METTRSINECLLANPVTRQFYVGCFPCDLIPTIKRFPAALIANHDASTMDGSHWVAMFAPSQSKIIYFDPFGDAAPEGPISDYLERFPRIIRNKCRFQPADSFACGAYAMFVVYHLCLGQSFDKVLSLLCMSPDPDRLVRTFVDFIC